MNEADPADHERIHAEAAHKARAELQKWLDGDYSVNNELRDHSAAALPNIQAGGVVSSLRSESPQGALTARDNGTNMTSLTPGAQAPPLHFKIARGAAWTQTEQRPQSFTLVDCAKRSVK